MDLSAASWTDVAGVDTELAVLPVGSTEQHGPHAPLSTDIVTAEAVAEAGVDSYDGEVIVGPTLPVGISAEHRRFPGTLWLRPETLRATITDVVGSLASHGFRRIVIVNGHGGNSAALQEAAAELTRSQTAFVVAFTWFEAVDEDVPSMGHAGPLETAMLREHAPTLVHEDRVDAAAADAAERWGEWTGSVNLAYDSDEFTENGVVGDPTRGDADLGAELTARAGAALADLLDAVATRDIA